MSNKHGFRLLAFDRKSGQHIGFASGRGEWGTDGVIVPKVYTRKSEAVRRSYNVSMAGTVVFEWEEA